MGTCACMSAPPPNEPAETKQTELTKPKSNNNDNNNVRMSPITENHSDYRLSVAIQNGLHSSLSSLKSYNSLDLPNSIKNQSLHQINHNVSTQNQKQIFTEYAPVIFNELRDIFGISHDTYLSVLAGDNKKLLSFLSNSKSGSYFFFSYNSQFIIKTLPKSEVMFLISILPEYYNYMKIETNSFIPEFYGIYKLNKFNKNRDISFIISNNVFYSSQIAHINFLKQYDLKGSTQGRKGRITNDFDAKSGSILKDLDFINDKIIINISKNNKSKLFHQQILKDTQFFNKYLIMDYSLLIGICEYNQNDNYDIDSDLKNDNDNNCDIFHDFYGGLQSDNGKEIYFLGIIDILQKYNAKKKLAGFVKGLKHEKITLSTVPPDKYADRFCNFFKDKII